MEARTQAALNRTTNVNVADANYAAVMARGIVRGAELTPGTSALTSGVIHIAPGTNARSGIHIGNASGLSELIGKAFFGVGGVARKIKRMYIGVPSEGHDLPAGYTELEYITSSGTQWIDSGVNPDDPTVELKVGNTRVQSGNTAYFFGVYQGSNNFTAGHYNNNGDVVAYSYKTGFTQTTVEISSPTIFTMSTAELRQNGEVVAELDGSYTRGTQNFLVFGAIRDGEPYHCERLLNADLYYCMIHDGASLVREFYPCRRDSDGAIGLYDKVSNTFFSNDGTGAFSAGPEVGGSRARVFFEAIPDVVPITITNSDRQTSNQARYITYQGRQYASAASFEASPGDTITMSVKGYNSQYAGKVTVGGTRVFTQSANSFGNYTYTVPAGSGVTIDLVQKSTTQGKTTYYYGEITVTEAT